MNHNRTKHIDIRHHFIRQAVKSNEIELKWISTEKQIADLLTKPLARLEFTNLRNIIVG